MRWRSCPKAAAPVVFANQQASRGLSAGAAGHGHQGRFRGAGPASGRSGKNRPGRLFNRGGQAAGAGKPFTVTVLTEVPDDFSALRASLGFASLDKACAPAGLQTAGKGVALFSGVALEQLQRRQINPVKLTVQATCGGKPVGGVVDLGQLEAGQRYSVLLMPAAGGAPRVVFAADTVAR